MHTYVEFWRGNPFGALFVHGIVLVIIAALIHEEVQNSRYQLPKKVRRYDR